MTQSILQPSLFEPPQVDIPGLAYLPNYIDEQTEADLLQYIDDQPWITELKRRVQHYGYRYDYRARSIASVERLDMLPDWLESYGLMMYNIGMLSARPDQVIINEYRPGQGIAPHIDCVPCFDRAIASISLCSSCMMDFTHSKTGEKTSLLLEPRSLLLLTGNEEALSRFLDCQRTGLRYADAPAGSQRSRCGR